MYLVFCFKFKHKIWGKTTYSPREGTETVFQLLVPLFFQRKTPYSPRQGTETPQSQFLGNQTPV